MRKKDEAERLAKTKLALAEKYDRLATEARSQPKKIQYQHEAGRHRRQAAEVLRT